MFYVYLITNKSEIYTGSTSNLKRRLAEHNAGKNFSTKSVGEWSIIYYEAHTNQDDAHRRERYLKTTQGKRAIKRMLFHALKGEKFLV